MRGTTHASQVLTGWHMTHVWLVLQGTSYPPQPCLISAKSVDPWHKVVRRGVSPAFSPENIRCVRSVHPDTCLSRLLGFSPACSSLHLLENLRWPAQARHQLFLSQQWLRCPCKDSLMSGRYLVKHVLDQASIAAAS